MAVAVAAYHSERERAPSRSMSAWAKAAAVLRWRRSTSTALMPLVKYGSASSASSMPRGARWSRLKKSACVGESLRRKCELPPLKPRRRRSFMVESNITGEPFHGLGVGYERKGGGRSANLKADAVEVEGAVVESAI